MIPWGKRRKDSSGGMVIFSISDFQSASPGPIAPGDCQGCKVLSPCPRHIESETEGGSSGSIYALTSQPGLYDAPWSGEPLFCILWVRVSTQVHTTFKTQVNIHLGSKHFTSKRYLNF